MFHALLRASARAVILAERTQARRWRRPPRPSAASLETAPHPGHPLGGAAHRLWRLQELDLVRVRAGALPAPVLDVGCGDGAFAELSLGRTEVGVDLDPRILDPAGKAYGAVVAADAAGSLPFRDGAFGSIVSNSTLEHIPDLERTLSELARICGAGGRLLVTVPLEAFTRALEDWVGPEAARRLNERLEHANLLELGQWVDRLARVGFEVQETVLYMPPGAVLAYRLLVSGFCVRVRPLNRVLGALVERTARLWLPRCLDSPAGTCALLLARRASR